MKNLQSTATTTSEINFIDGGLTDINGLISGLPAGATYYILDPAKDGVSQMADILSGYNNLEAVHIFSHGAPGSLSLGSTLLNETALGTYANQLATIGGSLSATGDLMLYGCNVAQGDVGQAFIQQLAMATGADVAASTDLTGSAVFGGDWQLEAKTGFIESPSSEGNKNFQGVLSATPYSSYTNYDLALAGNLAGLSIAAYSTGDALKAEVEKLGWTYVNEVSYFNPLEGIDADAVIVERNSSGKNELAIVFRGTQETTDFITDLQTYGFSNYYKSLRTMIENAIVQAVQQRYDNIYISGHSLGGAAAQIALLDMLEPTNEAIWESGFSSPDVFSPLQTGDRFLDDKPNVFSSEDWAWLRSHLSGMTFGAPGISIDAPIESWLNRDFDLDKYKNLLFQFEHKSNLAGYSGDPVAAFGDELGSLVALELSESQCLRYFALNGSMSIVSFHSSKAYFESLLRLLSNAPLLDEGNTSDFLPSLAQYSGTGSSNNDLVIPLSGFSSGGAGNDILLVRQSGNYNLNGGIGNDAYSLTSYGVNAVISGPTGEHLDRLYFSLLGEVSATVSGEDLIVTLSSPSGVSTAKIVGWYSLGNNYQLSEIAKIRPLEQNYWDKVNYSFGALEIPYFNTGTDNNDAKIIGSYSGDLMVGLAGNDRLEGRDGNDTIYGDGYSTAGTYGIDVIDGNEGNDTIFGDNPDSIVEGLGDTLHGDGGDDTIYGGGGVDNLYGDADNDTLYGQGGSDYLEGGTGSDNLYGDQNNSPANESGNDELHGNEGVDYLYGNAGNDFLYGEEDGDFLDGGVGDDELWGGMGNDYLFGDAGNDTLRGGSGDNDLWGGSGDDTLYSISPGDELSGGADNDTYILEARGHYTINEYGNGGQDKTILNYISTALPSFHTNGLDLFVEIQSGSTTYLYTIKNMASAGSQVEKLEIYVSYSDNGTAKNKYNTYNLLTAWTAALANDTTGGGALIASVDFDPADFGNRGTDGDDVLFGRDDRGETLVGYGGNDTLDGRGGNDRLFGEEGNDVFNVSGNSGVDTVDGGSGNDRLNLDWSGNNSGRYISFSIQKSDASWVHFGVHYDGGAWESRNDTYTTISSVMDALNSSPIQYKYATNGISLDFGYHNNGGEISSVTWKNIEFVGSVTGKSDSDFLIYQNGNSYAGNGGQDTYYADFSKWGESIVWSNDADSTNTGLSNEEIVNLGATHQVKVSGMERLLLLTGSGNDTITQQVTGTNDEFRLGGGNDTLTLAGGVGSGGVSDGNDSADMSSGDDTANIIGNSGVDTVDGGSGNDRLNLDWSGNNSGRYISFSIQKSDASWVHFGVHYDGGAWESRNDTYATISSVMDALNSSPIQYKYATNGISGYYNNGGEISSVTWKNIEFVGSMAGKSDSDFLIYQNGNSYAGNGGQDTYYADFSKWGESIVWSNGADSTNTGLSNEEIVNLGATHQVKVSGMEHLLLLTGSGNDTITQNITGTDDEFRLGAGNDTLKTGSGNDILQGDAGSDVLAGGDGNDTFRYLTKNDSNAILCDTLSDFANGDTLEFVGMAGMRLLSEAFQWQGNVQTTLTAIQNDGYLANSLVFFSNGADGWLAVRGAGSGGDFNGSLIKLQGRTTNLIASDISGESSVFSRPTLSVVSSVTSRREGEAGATTPFTFTINRNGDLRASSSVAWAVAESGKNSVDKADFIGGILPSGRVSFAIGESSKTITVYIRNDEYTEADETLTITLTNALGATISGANALATVLTDDNNIFVGSNNAEILNGSPDDDFLNALDGDDTLNGLTGNDLLDGGAGVDNMVGGLGSDTYCVDNAGDVVTETSAIMAEIDTVLSSVTYTLGNYLEKLTLNGIKAINGTGNALANTLSGNVAGNILQGLAGNDILDGGLGNDTLIGGLGNDNMIGGLGNDTYVVDSANDLTTESSTLATEIDTVISSVSRTLGNNLEKLILTGTATLGIGNALNNTLIGNASGNSLYGLAGNDILSGAGGNDYLDGGLGIDTAQYNTATSAVSVNLNVTAAQNTGGGGIDTLIGIENLLGSNLNDYLAGNSAANFLDGGLGNDNMIGGLGNDTYYVNSASDATTETSTLATEIDTVFSSVSRLLGNNLEKLTLIGTTAINGTGNALANTLIGNASGNSLYGLAGNDILSGAGGNDYLDGGLGIDTAQYNTATSAVSVNLNVTAAQNTGGGGIDTLIGIENLLGSNFNDYLVGNSAANILDGGLGNDNMIGGLGNDTYYVNSANDITTETSTLITEIDTVFSSASRLLGNNLERLTLIGSAAINGTGNALANTLIGNAVANILDGGLGNDILNGGIGNDTLLGGLGNDALTGGAGADSFLFNSALNATTNRDTIADFTVVDDTIRLDQTIFTKLTAIGNLNSLFFKASASGAAADANDYILYNTGSGALFYDADGNGAGAAVQFATLTGKPTITVADFVVVV